MSRFQFSLRDGLQTLGGMAVGWILGVTQAGSPYEQWALLYGFTSLAIAAAILVKRAGREYLPNALILVVATGAAMALGLYFPP